MHRVLKSGVSYHVNPLVKLPMRIGALGGQDIYTHLGALRAAGLSTIMLEMRWDLAQPSSSAALDGTYITTVLSWITAAESAGFTGQITLSLGAHYQPSWLTSLSAIKFIGEDGTVSTNVDTVWTQTAWNYYANFLTLLAAAINLNRFARVRVTSGPDGEFLFPSDPSRKWQMYGGAPQSGTDLIADQVKTPFPGWVIGSSNNGVTNSTQVAAVLDWYENSLVTCAQRTMALYRTLGWRGKFKVLISGQGLRPNGMAGLLSGWLTAGNIAAVGAIWYQVLPKLAALTEFTAGNAYIHPSSIGDGSGSPVDNPNDPTDFTTYTSVAIYVATSSATINNYSATRQTAILARALGIQMTGENTGYSAGIAAHYADTTSAGLMPLALIQAQAAGLLEYEWAHGNKLDTTVGGDGTVTLNSLVYNALT